MRIERVDIHDMHPFKEVHLDFTQIEGLLVAITGANGAGKTTLLELMFGGAIYRRCPTRGSLTELARSRKASVEVRAVNSHAYTILQKADAISGNSEALVLDAGGVPQLAGTSVRACDAWVAAHFPSPEVLHTGLFMAQASHGFLDLEATDRKRVFLQLLHLERYETLAERARDYGKRAKLCWERLAARLQEAERRYPPLAQTEAEVAESMAAVAQAQLEHGKALAQLELCRNGAQALLVRQTWTQRVETARSDLAELQEKLKNNRMLIERQADIEAAEQRLLTANADLSATEVKREATQARYERAVREADKLEESHAAKKLATARSAERMQVAAARQRAGAAVKKAVAKLPDAKAKLEAAKTKATELETAIAQAEEQQLWHKDGRIEGLRTGLKVIASSTERSLKELGSAQTLATQNLAADDNLKRDAASAPAKLQRMRTQLLAAQGTLEEIQEEVAKLRGEAARAQDLKTAKADADAAKADHARAVTDEAEALAAWKAAQDDRAQGGKELSELRARRTELQAQVQAAQKLQRFFEPMKIAKARLAELTPQAERLTAQLQVDEAELAALPPAPEVSLDTAEMAEVDLRCLLESARDKLSRRQERLVAARDGEGVIREINRELAEAQVVLTDWTRLSADLGKDGLQALEIDAAIPAINDLANDLLHNCHGPRYTVELRTDRLDAQGKRTLEDLDIRVLDTDEGAWKPAKRLSGGQKVIVGEAVSLALTMLVCSRNGFRHATLVRDESGAALDPGNGPVYIAMLRRAAAFLECDKVLFVTHNPELQALADARIVVSDGSAVVEQ